MMKSAKNNLNPAIQLSPQSTLRDAMEAITKTQSGIVLITSEDKKLLGIIVDSDMRRALLRGESMNAPLGKIMNPDPFTVDQSLSHEEIVELFKQKPRAYIPIVNAQRKIVGLANLNDYLVTQESKTNWIVIMAGGQGTRLRPLTNDRPKPMVKVGNKPVLEVALEHLLASRFRHFMISVNYLGNQIQEHFGDGSKWNAKIEYITELEEMGTAGALSLMQKKLEEPFIVMNGDILTKVNFGSLLEFHHADKNLVTIGVREYDMQVPYGVVNQENSKVTAIIEKPIHRFYVNAGIYVLDPEVLTCLPKNSRCDMPHFLNNVREKFPSKIGCYPVQEYWLDIGKHEDYQKALKDYEDVFFQ